MVDSTVLQLLLTDEAKYSTMPAGLFGRIKALLSISLNTDIFIITAVFFGLVNVTVTDDMSVVPTSFVNLGIQFFLVFTFAATLYGHYGLVTMNLSKFLTLVVLWIMTILTSILFIFSLFTSWMIYIYSDHKNKKWNFQAATCAYLGNTEYCHASKNDYFIMASIIAAMISIFKLAQMICLRILMSQAADFAEETSGRSNRSSNSGPNTNPHAGSDSEEDDVVVFERVFGRYPGGSKIKDASVA